MILLRLFIKLHLHHTDERDVSETESSKRWLAVVLAERQCKDTPRHCWVSRSPRTEPPGLRSRRWSQPHRRTDVLSFGGLIWCSYRWWGFRERRPSPDISWTALASTRTPVRPTEDENRSVTLLFNLLLMTWCSRKTTTPHLKESEGHFIRLQCTKCHQCEEKNKRLFCFRWRQFVLVIWFSTPVWTQDFIQTDSNIQTSRRKAKFEQIHTHLHDIKRLFKAKRVSFILHGTFYNTASQKHTRQ